MLTASVVYASFLILFFMQIVTIILVVRNGRKPQTVSKEPLAPSQNRPPRREREPWDNKRPPRPVQQDNKPRAPIAAVPNGITPIDKSLRDINLRLKNAEKNQERARREFPETTGGATNQRGPSERPERNDRPDNRPERSDRDRFNRGGGRNNDSRRGGGNQRRDNRPPRNFDAPRSFEDKRDEARPVSQPLNEPDIIKPIETAPIVEAVTPIVAATTIEPIVAVADDLEHGRKISVKRRVLKNGEEDTSDAPSMSEGSSEEIKIQETSSAQVSTPSAEKNEDEADFSSPKEISFGRR